LGRQCKVEPHIPHGLKKMAVAPGRALGKDRQTVGCPFGQNPKTYA